MWALRIKLRKHTLKLPCCDTHLSIYYNNLFTSGELIEYNNPDQ